MKLELIAIALLVIIFALSLLNTGQLKKITEKIENDINSAGEKSELGEWSQAEDSAISALDHWREHEFYTHIVLRHADIEELENDFYELLEHIYTQNSGAVKSAVKLVNEHLHGIYDMERMRIGSIF